MTALAGVVGRLWRRWRSSGRTATSSQPRSTARSGSSSTTTTLVSGTPGTGVIPLGEEFEQASRDQVARARNIAGYILRAEKVFPWFKTLPFLKRLVVIRLVHEYGIIPLFRFSAFMEKMHSGDYSGAADVLERSAISQTKPEVARGLVRLLRAPDTHPPT